MGSVVGQVWSAAVLDPGVHAVAGAAALPAGVPRRASNLQLVVETGVWTAASVTLVAPGIWFAAHVGNPLQATRLLPVVCACLGVGVIAAIVGTLASLALTREDHLFRYFKNR